MANDEVTNNVMIKLQELKEQVLKLPIKFDSSVKFVFSHYFY
jgi:hypothetical protein